MHNPQKSSCDRKRPEGLPSLGEMTITFILLAVVVAGLVVYLFLPEWLTSGFHINRRK
jgi:hypothetical protein